MVDVHGVRRADRTAGERERRVLGLIGRRLATAGVVIAAAVAVLPPAPIAQPWEYRCRSAISSVNSAANDAERARSSAEDAYERYKSAKEDYESCRRWERDCEWRRWDAESAKSSAESELDTFNSRLRSLFSNVDEVKTACGEADYAVFSAAARACRAVRMLKRRSQQEALDYCRKANLSDVVCRMCME